MVGTADGFGDKVGTTELIEVGLFDGCSEQQALVGAAEGLADGALVGAGVGASESTLLR